MNKSNIFNWFKGRKREQEKAKKEEVKEEKTIEVEDDINDVFIGTIPTHPFSYVKENKEPPKQKEQEEQSITPSDINDEFISDIFIGNIFTNAKEEEIADFEVITSIQNSIMNEIEKMLLEDVYKINRIKYELELLQNNKNDELTKDEADKLIDKLNDLIKRFEKIKKEFYAKNYDKLDSGQINDAYISSLIEDYKNAIRDNDIKNIGLTQIQKIEEYIDIIDTMVAIEDSASKLNDTLEDRKEEMEVTDKDIEAAENEYTSIEKVHNYIENFTKDQDSIINDIKRKVENSTKITKIAEYKTSLSLNYSKLLASTLLMASSQMIPPTKNGNLLKIGLMAASIASLASVVRVSTKETKVTTKINYIDYGKEINSNIGNVNDIDKMIGNSTKDIKDLRKNFIKEFSKHKNIVPEYTELLKKLDTLEKELVIKAKLAKEYEEKLQEILKQNNVKVKRLEEEHFG